MDEVEVPEGETGVTETVEPEAFEVAEEALYRLDADGDPIPGSELKSGWLRQSDYTRKTQELQERRKEYERQQKELQESAQQYQERVRQHYENWARQQVQQYAQQRGAPQDPLAAIWQKAEANGGIVTVEEAKLLAEQMQGQLQQSGAQYGNVLQALQMLNDRVNQLQTPLSTIQQERQESRLESRLNSFLDDNSIPHGEMRNKIGSLLKEWEPTQEERLAGKDLEDTWEEILSTFTTSTKEIERSQASAAAKNLGRKGGEAKPSKGVKGPMTVEEIVEATFDK